MGGLVLAPELRSSLNRHNWVADRHTPVPFVLDHSLAGAVVTPF
jgi:hypothetical protein